MLKDELTKEVAERLKKYTIIKDIRKNSNRKEYIAKNGDNHILHDGIQISVGDYYLCVTGGFGNWLFVSPMTIDLTTIFSDDTSDYDYLAEHLNRRQQAYYKGQEIIYSFKFVCQAIAYILNHETVGTGDEVKTYKLTIQEVTNRHIEVDAYNEEEALTIANIKYDEEDIDLNQWDENFVHIIPTKDAVSQL